MQSRTTDDGSAPPTTFLPAGRAAPEAIDAAARSLASSGVLEQALEAMPVPACVLNGQRQIVAVNTRFLVDLGLPCGDEVLGKRLGEALECIRSAGPPDGCGTTQDCVTCGAAQAMRASIDTGRRQSRECRITIDRCGDRASLDVEAVVSPLWMGGDAYLICALRDIAAEKRRDALERVFYHDILNTAGGLAGLAELTVEPDSTEQGFCDRKMLARLAQQLVEEVQAQRALSSAERGELLASLRPVAVPELLVDLAALYREHDVADGRIIKVLPGAPAWWTTDAVLLRRVVGNLLKNALEATSKGGTVTVQARTEGDTLIVAVQNEGRMPDAVQAQVFQRSFSTKGGTGRGLGTSSVHLLVERVLGGSVSFVCDERGTTFVVRLPRPPLSA